MIYFTANHAEFEKKRHDESVEFIRRLPKTIECHQDTQKQTVTIFPTLFLSYVIVYLHFFGHLFFILVLLIYDYSSTVCLLRRLFMHCPCAYSCAYSCTACLLMDSLTVQYIRTEWTLLFCS